MADYKHRQAFTDLYKMASAHGEMGNTADDWVSLAKDATAYLEANKDDFDFAQQLLIGFYHAMENERKTK